MKNHVQIAHGSGGQTMQQLISELFMRAFSNPWLAEQEDQARIALSTLTSQGDRLAFSTDSYVIDPLFFSDGNIGKLAVCGTANDVAVSGAVPQFLSCGFILEEGLEMVTLGDHGATVLNLREKLGLDGELQSDCAVLTPFIQALRDIPGVKALRDATRSGVNAVAHEFAASSSLRH